MKNIKKLIQSVGAATFAIATPLIALSCGETKNSNQSEESQKAAKEQKFVSELSGPKKRVIAKKLDAVQNRDFNSDIAQLFGIEGFMPKSDYAYSYSHPEITANGVANVELVVKYQNQLAPSATSISIDFEIDQTMHFFDLTTYSSPSKLASDLTDALKITMPESGLKIFKTINETSFSKVQAYSNGIDLSKAVQMRFEDLEVTLDFTIVKPFVEEIKAILSQSNAQQLASRFSSIQLDGIGLTPNAPIISALTTDIVGLGYARDMSNFLALARLEDVNKTNIEIAKNHPYFNMLHAYHQVIYKLTSSNAFKRWNLERTYEFLTWDLDLNVVKSLSKYDQPESITFSTFGPQPTNVDKGQISNFEAQFAINLLNVKPRSLDEKDLVQAKYILVNEIESTSLNPFAYSALEIKEPTIIDTKAPNNIVGITFPSNFPGGVAVAVTKELNSPKILGTLSKGNETTVFSISLTKHAKPTQEEIDAEQQIVNTYLNSGEGIFNKALTKKEDMAINKSDLESYGFTSFNTINGIQYLITHDELKVDGSLSFTIKVRFKQSNNPEDIITSTVTPHTFTINATGINLATGASALISLMTSTLTEANFEALSFDDVTFDSAIATQLGINFPTFPPDIIVKIKKNAGQKIVDYTLSKNGQTTIKVVQVWFNKFAS